MAASCMSTCINDTMVPLRPTYVSLNKWPESDAAFVRSVSDNYERRGGHAHARVVDSISCRQMYLRSYTFTREEELTVPEKISQKCFGGVKEKMKNNRRLIKRSRKGKKYSTKYVVKTKEVSCAALLSIFRRLLSCTAKVDVADR
ncbi:hypothetical protein Pint_32289 [Pistacia integerrima]|uniref:Uncharacterized protein n=1 Tax=Pistacia integerrima TaxID=434235 RepID=A0ACC0XPS2_9ROSI|nr:hypothetical protein Pint_32289 [Pistacia integerrima]